MEPKIATTIRLPESVKNGLQRVAKTSGLSVNAVVILAIREHIDRHDKKKAGTPDA